MKCEWEGFIPWLDIERPADVLSQSIGILDLFDRFDVEYYPANPSQYKVRCPFHSDGLERNPSCIAYIDTNSYHCFACQANGNIIDFAAHQLGLSNTPGTKGYNTVIEQLCVWAGITSGESIVNIPLKVKRSPEETVEYWVAKTGEVLREFLKTKATKTNYAAWCSWTDQKFERLDRMLDGLKDDDWKRAQAYFEHIKKQL